MEIKAYKHLPKYISNELSRWEAAYDDCDLYHEAHSPNGGLCFFAIFVNDASPSGSRTLAGFLSLLPVDGEKTCEITAFVLPQFRGRGFFTAMLDKARRAANVMFLKKLYVKKNMHMGNLEYSHSELLMKLDLSDTEYIGKHMAAGSVRTGLTRENFTKGMPCGELCDDNTAHFDKIENEITINMPDGPDAITINMPDGPDVITINMPGAQNAPLCRCNLSLNTRDGECIATKDRPRNVTSVCIWGVYTLPECRGNGLATRLMTYVLDLCKKNFPSAPILLQVSSLNEPALHLYKKAGFRETDRIDYYYI